MWRVLAALLAISGACLADDLVLKDGRRLAWKSIADEGDSYAIVTKDGKAITLKKSEVDRLAVGSQDEPAKPLTGASFSLDVKKCVTVDLLPKAKTEATGGAWKSAAGALANTGENPGRVTVPFEYDPPEEYDLTIVVERKGGTQGFDVGLVTGDYSGAYYFDAFGAAASCFGLVSGAFAGRQDGQVFKPGKSRTVKISVRKDAVLVQLDGKEYWKGRVDWKCVTVHPDVPNPEKKRLFLCAAGGAWKVTAFTVTHLK